jgi:hypothetical protein
MIRELLRIALIVWGLKRKPKLCPRCDGRTITGPWSCPTCGKAYSL